MTINESITELEKALDSIEPCIFIDGTMYESMKTAIEVMRKYQKIEEILKEPCIIPEGCYPMLKKIKEVVEE